MDIFFPPLCHRCKEPITTVTDTKLCTKCLSDVFPIRFPICKSCGRPFLTENGEDHLCSDCVLKPQPYEAARAALIFKGSIKDIIYKFKYQYKVHLRRSITAISAEYLDKFVADFAPDILIPVPLHKKRLRKRGFNQAILIGEIFAKRWDIKMSRNNLKRIRWTEPQVNLPASQREKNVLGAFALKTPALIADKRVLLFDDVYTTGSTVKECSKVLVKSGAASVAVVTIARTEL